MVEFTSNFGANPGLLNERLDLAEKKLRDIDRLYLEYDFQSSLSHAKGLLTDLEDAIDHAMKLRNRTMFWIYMIEWTILTSTAVLTGTVVWTLMVRRRLYLEVGITRLNKPQ
jgi:hypothetical protein